MLAMAGFAMAGLMAAPAAAQFSAREGYTPSGAYQFNVELTPYLFLPAVNASIGLHRTAPSLFDGSVNRGVPSIGKVLSSLNMAFIGDGLVRYGPYSAELDVQYIDAFQKRTAPPGPLGRQATLKTDVSMVRVSPGIGYEVLPTDAGSRFTLDARVGLQYFSMDINSGFEGSPFGGISRSTGYAEPWLGLRGTYYVSPNWRITADAAATGFGVDNGSWGWNGRLTVSYLVTSWFDVSLGGYALQTNKPEGGGLANAPRSLHLLTYGPIVALGFRF
jgi:long-subunit fatty acid transport protein